MLGFFIVLLSSLLFCFQNVIVRVLFNEYTILGIFQTGGFVTPNLQNSFLLLFMRMVLVVPLMSLLVPKLYPPTWKDIRKLSNSETRQLLLQALAGGLLMFLYLVLLYISVGLIPTGIALTLFFTYPVFTALFSWGLFGNRPTLFRWSVMVLILLGIYLSLPNTQISADNQTLIGVIAGVASGVTYALYTVNAQKSFEKMHPVPFTWISFTTTLVLSVVSFLIWNVHDLELAWAALWIGSLFSALFTFAGHLINNFGIRLIGAATVSMISASNPALTVILAWLVIQETLNSLQLFGVVLVVLSVGLLGRESSLSKQA
ncbi:MAG: EamA family transporter [Symploca sp. SIO2B6]|nr:EamA family transporter [Symploca sp. SIO2B6]